RGPPAGRNREQQRAPELPTKHLDGVARVLVVAGVGAAAVRRVVRRPTRRLPMVTVVRVWGGIHAHDSSLTMALLRHRRLHEMLAEEPDLQLVGPDDVADQQIV